MTEGRTLQPGDEISHYRVVGPLGAGGMGEVYLAQDLSLERNVALKVLPAALVRNAERVRRFVLEAKSASSLNHPNIVTIYEIGQGAVRTTDASGEVSESEPVHFISMELISGKTLGALIHDEKVDLRTLLGHLAQAAEGIAKAHTAGIVHRDLKPGNIMVTPDGFAKVLDFGLAKLTEKRQTDVELSSAATMSPDATGEGIVLGTAGYMSPEQVQGKAVDHRSDIFAFGCLLYETTTGQRPFAAESGLETMHKIVNEKPQQVEELNPKAPAELRRVIRRCLAKNPEQRLQSMKDVALELREIVDEFDSLSASATSGSMASGAGVAVAAGRRVPAFVLVGLALVIGVGGILAGVWGWQRSSREEPGAVFASMRVTALTNVGDASDGVLSPDGRYLAYASGPGNERKLWVRQVATGSDVEVLPLKETRASGLVFSPDGEYLYYIALDPDRSGYRALFKIPSLGGTPQKQVFDIDSPISFAPDGKRGCFMRGVPDERMMNVVLVDLESKAEQVLAKVRDPRQIIAGPVWSPLGDRVAIAEGTQFLGPQARIVTFAVADGKRDSLGTQAWPFISSIAWQADGKGLLLAGLDLSATPVTQIFSVSYPRGQLRRLTNDFNQYWGISLSADGQSVSAMRQSRSANIWSVPTDGSAAPRQLTFTSGSETVVGSLELFGNDTILYTAPEGQYVWLFALDADGSNRRALTTGPTYLPSVEASESRVAFQMLQGKDLKSHLWIADPKTGEITQLTNGEGEWFSTISRDGSQVLFRYSAAPTDLWTVPSSGGEPRKIFDGIQGPASFSPDGKRILATIMRLENGLPAFGLGVLPASGGAVDTLENLPPQTIIDRWHPDGAHVTFTFLGDDGRNVFQLPISGGPPEPLTQFADGRTQNFRWSPDGTRLLIERQVGRTQNLWIVDANGRNPRQLTSFQAGDLFDAKWSADGKRIVFTYGDSSRDVVLLRSEAS